MNFSARLYVPVYAATLLLSAFLLFVVQPMFGKMILPLLGGTPSVWNTAMLFFQCLLLAGYAYAHATARLLTIRFQAALHGLLLLLFTVVLPLTIPEGWQSPPSDRDPTLWQLGLMALAVGGPFFILSGSAPMLQHWFAHSTHKDSHNPYFLYAASNLGSMTSLIAYPFLIEPAFAIDAQSHLWSMGYYLLIVFVSFSALLVWRHADKVALPLRTPANDHDDITWKRRGLWLLLAFIPSSLMLGVTTFITTDLASVPLLWIVPLALYVGTFIIVFARKPFPSRNVSLKIQGILLIFLLASLASFVALEKPPLIILHLLLFFFTALACHHELATLRPHARHLTQFYLIMSLGGALGGVFNALIAPVVFTMPIEYAIVLALASFMRFASDEDKSLRKGLADLKACINGGEKKFIFGSGLFFILLSASLCLAGMNYFNNMLVSLGIVLAIALAFPLLLPQRWTLALCALVILAFNPPGYVWGSVVFKDITFRDRNFFGVVRVAEKENGIRSLLHGTTIHGDQPMDPTYRLEKLSYYSPHSGVSDAFTMAQTQIPGAQHVAVLGLGIGVTACYTHDGRSFDFFEIDPSVIEVAENPDFFTYLSDCGSPYEIVRGDARLTIQDKPDGYYDMILMDAFSSDNIPVHLITYEALKLYQSKLSERGFLVMNISNRYLNLKPVAAAAADALGLTALRKFAPDGTLPESGLPYKPSEFVVLTDNPAYIDYLKARDWETLKPSEDVRLWTDQFSNIVSVLKILQ